MRISISLVALVSLVVPALAENLDQRRTLTVEDEWMARVVVEPLSSHAKNTKKSRATGVAHFHGGLDAGPVVVRRISRQSGAQIRYRVKPAKGTGVRVSGSFRTAESDDTETLSAVSLRVRGKAPRRRVKGTAGAEYVQHDPALVLPAIDVPFVEIIHATSLPELTSLARVTVMPDGHAVAVGHVGFPGERERTAILRATTWTVRPGSVIEPATLGPDPGVALGVAPGGAVIVGRMEFSGSTSSDALWLEKGNGLHVTDFGEPASGLVFEATHVTGGPDGELVAVLRVITGGSGTVRWSSVTGETALERPRETISHTVFGMDDRGETLVGHVAADGRLALTRACVWGVDGAVTTLGVGRDAGTSARAVSPDGRLVAGVLLDLFTDREPLDQHVLWDATDSDRAPVAIRSLVGARIEAGVNGGPTAVTRSGLVAGWDLEGAFVWRSGWPSAVSFRAYLEEAGLALPRGERDELKDAIDVVGGTLFAGTTRQGDGDRLTSSHWVAFVPRAPR